MDLSTVQQQAFPSCRSHVCVQNFPIEANLSSTLHAHDEETEHLVGKEQDNLLQAEGGGEVEVVVGSSTYNTSILCHAIAPPYEPLVPSSCHCPLKNACFSCCPLSPFPPACITSQEANAATTTHTHTHMNIMESSSASLSFIKNCSCTPPLIPPNITSHVELLQQSTSTTSYIDPILSLENSFSTVHHPCNGSMIQSQAPPVPLLLPSSSSSSICVPDMLNYVQLAAELATNSPAALTLSPPPLQPLPYTHPVLASHRRTPHSLDPVGSIPSLSAPPTAQLPLLDSPLQFFYSSTSCSAAPSKRAKPSSPPPPPPPPPPAPLHKIGPRCTKPSSLSPATPHYNIELDYTRPSISSPAPGPPGLPASSNHYPIDIELSYHDEHTSPLVAQSTSPPAIGQLVKHNHAAGSPIATTGFHLMFPSLQEPHTPHTPSSHLSFPSNPFSTVVGHHYAPFIHEHHDTGPIPYAQPFPVNFEDPSSPTLGADHHLPTSSSMAACEFASHTLRELDHTSSSGSTKLYSYRGEEGNIENANLSSNTSPSPNASPTNVNMSSIPTKDWINPNTSSNYLPTTTTSPNPTENRPSSATPNPNPRRNKISVHPQGVAARRRRHKISHKFKILQTLVPGGTKMDTASMLDEAIEYIKYLRRQIWLHQLLEVSQLINSTSLSLNDCEPNCVESPVLTRTSSPLLLPSCNSSLSVGTLPSSSPPPHFLWPTFNI